MPKSLLNNSVHQNLCIGSPESVENDCSNHFTSILEGNVFLYPVRKFLRLILLLPSEKQAYNTR